MGELAPVDTRAITGGVLVPGDFCRLNDLGNPLPLYLLEAVWQSSVSSLASDKG